MIFLDILGNIAVGDVFQALFTVGAVIGVYVTLQNRVTRLESKQDNVDTQIASVKSDLLSYYNTGKGLESIINNLNVAVAKLQVTVENLEELMKNNKGLHGG